ncbi:MAG: HAMP domain-containing protein [Desulfatitalea sp.]
MIIHCEKCRKAYKIDPGKLTQNKSTFRCKACGNAIVVSTAPADHKASAQPAKPQSASAPSAVSPPVKRLAAKESAAPTEPAAPASAAKSGRVGAASAPAVGSKRRLGVSGKMLLLFFCAPIGLMVLASAAYVWQLKDLSSRITVDSNTIVERLSHEMVNDKARMVASQCRLYLQSHAALTPAQFDNDPEFRKLALQTVGETGYTCIYAIPDPTGKSGVWVHPNAKIIGIDLPEAMKKSLGERFPRWWTIYKGAYTGKPSSGYYTWQEKDGSLREKYMTCVPVEGTPYVVAATTYVDEITRDVQNLKATGHDMTRRAMTVVFAIFVSALVLMGSTVLFYSRRLSGNLKTLIHAAERISVGELNTRIDIRSNDEIKDLADTVSRMQESIRLSIERLRKRR